ncbi:hypothetical protein Smp_073450 [Schistosoma mansoni]|nr:hypothetical protein Smp_073450 [Schistosoma mansoni]|eukprot:XP_018655544.1 hypothetical protein Smp_073450 [Schistosoma mansoni]
MATESLQARLTDFERQARGVCIGVNHLALDSERVRQAELLQKIIQLEKDIQQSSAQKSHLPEAAAEIRDDVKNNTSALRYLETISQLENSFTVLTENVTETSVQLSAPKELKDEVHVKKELTGNVKSCWTYVSQLARLSQVHIRNAAEYHQFHHAVNEAEASLKARVRMTEPRNTRALPATLKNCTILANELREHLNHMIHLWGRSGNLLEESRRIVPVHLRLGGVIDGLSTNTESASPVMARMLTSLTGPNYELKEGEEVRVISNKDDQHFWTVQTNNGIVKIPSVCLWISDPDLEAVKRSVIHHMDIQYQHKIAMDNFLEDLRGLLLPNDTRATELSQAIYAFTDRLKMTDINRQRSPHGGVFLREQDIVCMHSPLLRLRDHERQMDHLRAQSELAGTHMTNYLREIDADQKRVDQELSLIDQLQHESQSQLDQLINRVKRWSSRYEHEPNVDSSISNSRMSSSLKSSTISDNWAGNNQMYPIDARSPQSIVRETSRLSSRTRSESIPRPVLDAITQIGVTTKTTGTQISHDDGDGGRNEIDLSISKRHFMPATIPERKQVRNAITQIGVSKVDAGTQDDYHGYSPKRSVKEVLCQIGQITANASCQTLEHYKLQQTLKKPTLDAVVQSGVITKNNSTQSEYITETVVKMDIPESQKAARKYSVLDAICQIGQVTQTTGTQTEVKNTERNKKNLGVQAEMKKAWQHTVNTNEAACQIGRITINASTEMSPMMVSKEEVIKQDIKKSDIICQIGKVEMTKSTQTNATEKLKTTTIKHSANQYEIQKASTSSQVDVLTEKTYKRTLKSVNDVICQVGQVNHEVSTQSVEYVTTRPAHKDTGIDPIHVWEKKTANDVVTQTGIVHTSKVTQAELIQEQPVYVKAIETQDVPITSYRNTVDAYQQADLIKHMLRKPSSDVVCQVGSVMESSGIQIDEPHKTSMLLAGTQSAKTPTHTKEIQTDMGFRMEPKFVSKAVNDVICQVGQVNHEVSTQSVEYVTTRPAHKDTGIDPIHVWEKKTANDVVTQTGIVHTSKVTQAELIQEQPVYVKAIETQDVPITSYRNTVDAYQQADLIKHMLRKPSSDVVCQVGSVMESSGIQIDEPHKTSMLLAGTQSAKTPTHTKEIQTDMGFRMEPKFVSKAVNDVICQVGQVNHEVSTQTGIPSTISVGVDPRPEVPVRHLGSYQVPPNIEQESRQVQADIKQTLKHIDMQTEAITRETLISTNLVKEKQVEIFDVTTQFDIVTKEKDVQTFVTCRSKETQTIESSPESEVKMRSQQTFTRIRSKNYDVQTQSGTINISQAFQTLLDYKPTTEKRSTGMQHEVDKGVVETTYHEPQTQETPTQTERARIKDQQTFTSIELKTFDVQTQFGSILKTQAAQTPGEQKTVVEVRDMTMQHHKSPEPIVHKKLQAIVQPPTINTETQTMVERPPPIILPPKVFDVQTQSGSVTVNSETQTPQEHRPVVATKDASVYHETRPVQSVPKKLQAIVVRPLENMATQTDFLAQPVVMPMVQTTHHEPQTQETPTQTERARIKDQQTFTSIELKTFDVQTQFGSILKTQAAQTPGEQKTVVEVRDMTMQHHKSPEPIVHKKLQAIVQPPTINTETQTMVEGPPPVILPPKVFDVQTQSGTVTINSETQTPQEHRPIIEVKDLITQHEKRPEPIVHKKLQAIVQPPTINTETQTMVERPPPIILPPKVFDVQTQSGSVTINSETQTPQEHRPIIEVKDLITQHEKRPEPIVHKKLQAIVQPPTINTETQTMVERPTPVILPPKVFDVQTQSGSVTINSETQTPHEPKIIPAIKDASVIHEPHHVHTVNKKLQAVVYHPSDDVCLQTDEVTVQPVKPVPQAFSRAPQVEHKQTQAEWLKTKTKTFDIQAQSGIVVKTQSTQTILEERPMFHTADVSVIHSEKSPLLVNKKLQVTIGQSVENTSTQTDPMAQVPTVLPKTTFDVVTQSGTVHCAQSVQTIPEEQPVFHTVNVGLDHTEKSPSLVGKKLQATMRQSVENTSTQTDPMAQVPTVLPKTTFDVVTQSGTVHCAQSVQTIPEEQPVFHTVNVGLDHTEKSPSLVGKKLQATMRQSVENTSTQTDPMAQVPTVLPKTTFDVVTQSGTVHCAQSVQTIPEERPVFHTVSVGVDLTGKLQSVLYENVQATMRQSVENTSTQTDPMAQVPTVLPKTTFDVVTQSGTVHCAQSVQTIPEEQPVFHTVNVGLDHTEKSPSLVGKKLQATMRQSVENTSTQTDPMAQVPTVLPKTTFDVVTQSGTVHCAQSVQTIPEERPVFHTVSVGLDHTEKSPSLVGKKLQATMRQSVENTSTQTDPMAQVPTVLPKTTFDVVTQSGTVHCAQSVQTIPEERPVFCTVDVSVDHVDNAPIVRSTVSSTMHTLPNTSQSTQTIPTKLADTFCQTTLSSITYDVQIQSGVIHSVDGTQTVDLTPPIAMKEMSVVHEKEPTILKGKKLQVRCDSTDLGIQTDQITPIVQPTISSTMHTLPNTSQSTQTIPTKLADTFCQTTLSSITYDVQIQSGVIHSVDGTQTVDLTPPIAMKEMSVVHEKEPTILKGKKLQVRCDSTDLGVQTDHTMSTVHLDSKLTQTALVHYTDVSCQYTELTKPSSTSHVVTSRVVSIQTDVPFSTNIRVDQRNKKFQVNLISPSSPKTPTNVASIGTQTSDYRYQDISIEQVDKTTVSSVDAYMVHDSVSNVTSTSQAIPKIKIDQECQVKITPQQYQKKLQCGPSFSTLKNTSSQTIQDSCLRDHQRTSLSSSIGVQVSNVRPVVTVDTGTQETRPSETSPSPLQVKNKKLQVYPSKLGEQVEEEFIHPQETICKGMSTSLTEITQTDECLLKNTECFKCISRGGDKKTIDKDVQSEEKSIRTKQTASSTVKSNYFTRILQMETIPDKPKAPDTSDVLKLYRESGYRAKGESRDVQTDAFLLGSIQLPESKEVDGVGKISKKTTIVQLEKLTTDKCVDTMPFEKGLIESQTSYHDIQTSERRNVRLPKETPWPEAQATNVLQDIQFEIRHPQMIDSSGSYSPQQNSVSVSARPTTHMLTHAESTSRNGNGKVKTPYQYLKPDVVSWGVQFAPVTLTGVTQTTESSKHKLAIDSSVNISVQTDAVEDDYYIKRVVTTIARKGLSSYCRRGPVAKKIVEHTDLLTSSLPSNLDEEFDEETTIGPRTTKVTTMQKRGDRRVVHEELLTEDYRERGSSLDSRVAHGQFPRETHPQDIDLHEMHEHETDIYTDAEICLQNLLKVWGEQYLLSRLRTIGRYSELSVSLDRSIHTAEKSRLVEAKTQFTSTGNLVSQIRNLENIGTQTSDILLITRPPHKNKRIQRGRSFISGGTNQPPPTRSGSVVSPLSPTTEELTSHHRQHGITSMQTRTSHPFNLATTTFTETTQEQSTFSIEHTVQTYTCPTCGSQANIPVTVHSQIQPQTLPITQLKDAQSQTRFMGQMTTDNNCTYLPTYLSDEEVIRINQSQKIEDREFSMVTWHPAEIRDTERRRDSDTSNQIRDEVWVDSPGKLLELKITGVIVPGTSEIVSASEAFYRGLLRVVYWDYEKLGPRQSSVDSTVSIPLADAVISKAVRLASDRISTETQPSLDAKIVWRTPEIQRSRYLVHSIRPDAGQNKHNPINLDVASAIRAGLIDKETGQMLFTHSVYESPFSTDSPISKKGDSSSDQTERLSVREAIVRGFLVAELIEPESSYITKQSLPFIVPSTSYSHSPTDVDI